MAATENSLFALDVRQSKIFEFSFDAGAWRGLESQWFRTAITTSTTDEFLLVGTMDERVLGFALREGGLMEVPETQFALNNRVDGLCGLEAGIFARSPDPESSLNVSRLNDGDTRAQFEPGYQAGTSSIQSILSRGTIACDRHNDVVIVGFTHLPTLRGYSWDGTLLWETEIPGFVPMRLTADAPSGSRVLRSSDDGESRLLSIVVLESPIAMVQVASLGSPNDGARRITAVRTFLVNSATGEGVRLGSELPRILAAHGRRLFGVEVSQDGSSSLVQLSY